MCNNIMLLILNLFVVCVCLCWWCLMPLSTIFQLYHRDQLYHYEYVNKWRDVDAFGSFVTKQHYCGLITSVPDIIGYQRTRITKIGQWIWFFFFFTKDDIISTYLLFFIRYLYKYNFILYNNDHMNICGKTDKWLKDQ